MVEGERCLGERAKKRDKKTIEGKTERQREGKKSKREIKKRLKTLIEPLPHIPTELHQYQSKQGEVLIKTETRNAKHSERPGSFSQSE